MEKEIESNQDNSSDYTNNVTTSNNDYSYYELDGTAVMVDNKTLESYRFSNGKFIIGPSISIIQDDYYNITKEKFNQMFPGLEQKLTDEKKNDQIIRENIEDVLNIKKIESKFQSLLNHFESNDKVNIEKACDMMKRIHLGQYRDEGTPYYTHCLSTATIAMENGGTVEDVIVSLLHDTLEDGADYKVIVKEIVDNFGQEILESIMILSKNVDGKKKNIKEYFDTLKDSKELKIKAFDRLSNIRSLLFCPDQGKIVRYIKSTKEDILPMIETKYTKIASEINDIIHYINTHKNLSEEEIVLLSDLKKLQIAKTKFMDNDHE